MRRALGLAVVLLLLAVRPVSAHREDEYLQATTVMVSRATVQLSMRLTPGIAVASTVLDSIDFDLDGVISEAELVGYGDRVTRDLHLSVDHRPVELHFDSARVFAPDEIRAGSAEIRLDLHADAPAGGTRRRLVLENRHRRAISVYLVNALVPIDHGVRVAEQIRDETQSMYEMVYLVGAGSPSGRSVALETRFALWTCGLACVLLLASASLRRFGSDRGSR